MNKIKSEIISIIVCIIAFLTVTILDCYIKGQDLLFYFLYVAIYLGIGYDVIIKAVRGIFRGKVLDENFLMTIATVCALCLSLFIESVAVMLFYKIGELFQKIAVRRARKSISSLVSLKPETAIILDGEIEKEILVEEIKVGDILLVKAGEKIAVDGIVVQGKTNVDTSFITGESMPLSASENTAVISGCLCLDGVLHIKAEKEYGESAIAKILDMVENASSKKTATENFVTRFAKIYTPIVCGLAVIIAGVLPLFFGYNQPKVWFDFLKRALNFLVVSCPCALVISVPLTFFAGLGLCSSYGLLVKGSKGLESLAKVNHFVFDKTGTLTEGQFKVREYFPSERKQEILTLAGICESKSTHHIAKSILKEIDFKIEKGYYIEEIAGQGIKAQKGDDVILCGNENLLKSNGVNFKLDKKDGTVVLVAKNGEFVGGIILADKEKAEAREVVSMLKKEKIKTTLLSGDRVEEAERVANLLEVDDYKGELMPLDKVKEVEKLKSSGEVVGFAGDGINDAPVLLTADCAISMGASADASIEASDAVLIKNDLTGIIKGIVVGRKANRVVKQNIVLAISVKIAVLILSLFGLSNMFLAIFADVGICVIAILNALRCSKIRNIR